MNNLIIETVVYIIAATWFITNFEPIKNGLNKLKDLSTQKLKTWLRTPLNALLKILTCVKCLSFWTALIFFYLAGNNLFHSFLIACVTALIAFVIDNNLLKIKL